MSLKFKSFPVESTVSNLRMIQQHMHWTFMQLGHAISVQVFYYSLFLNVFYFNATGIFLFDGGGGGTLGLFTVNTLKPCTLTLFFVVAGRAF